MWKCEASVEIVIVNAYSNTPFKAYFVSNEPGMIIRMWVYANISDALVCTTGKIQKKSSETCATEPTDLPGESSITVCLCFVARIHFPHHPFPFPFHSIRNSVDVTEWMCSHESRHIFSFVLPLNSMVFPHRFPSFFVVATAVVVVFLHCFHIIVEQTLLKLEFSARVLRTKRKNCVFSTVRTSNGTHKFDGRQSNIEYNTRWFSVSSYFSVELFAHQSNCYGWCGLWVYFNLKFSQQTLWSESVHSSV